MANIRVAPFCGANLTYLQLEVASEHVGCSLPNHRDLELEALFVRMALCSESGTQSPPKLLSVHVTFPTEG